jgi:hypothetical protein
MSDVARALHLARGLHRKLDAAGHADALEVSLLRSSDVIGAKIELDQRPIVGGFKDVSGVSQEGI